MTRNCQHPQLVALPSAWLQPRDNQLDMKVMGFPLRQVASRQRAGGLSAVELGPVRRAGQQAQLAHGAWRSAARSDHRQLLLVGALIFAMGWINRAQSLLAYFGALLVGWAWCCRALWWRDMPLAERERGVLLAILASFVTLAAVQFLLRYAGERRRWVDVGLPAQCAVMPLTLMVAGPHSVCTRSPPPGTWCWRSRSARHRCCTCARRGARAANSSGRWPRWAP